MLKNRSFGHSTPPVGQFMCQTELLCLLSTDSGKNSNDGGVLGNAYVGEVCNQYTDLGKLSYNEYSR